MTYEEVVNLENKGCFDMQIQAISCKYCGSNNIVKYGMHNDVQYLWCKDCERKFAANDALPSMRTPVGQIASAIQLFYEGSSINDIRKHLRQTYNNYPSESTVYEWVTKFTKEAIGRMSHIKPNVGYVWLVDETMLDIGGKKLWYWDVLDVKTRYLIASHLSPKRTVDDVILLMHNAVRSVNKLPKVVMTDRLNAYVDGMKLSFGSHRVKHLQVKKFTSKPNNNIIERMQGTIKERTKVMRGMKKYDTAKLIMEGFRLHYNYFRPHESLATKQSNYRTPSEAAHIELPYDTWLGMIRSQQPEQRFIETPIVVNLPQLLLTREQKGRKRERERKRTYREKQRQAKPKLMKPRLMGIKM